MFSEFDYPLASKIRIHNKKGYLPIYIMSVFIYDSNDRKNWFNKAFAKRDGVVPLGQMHMVAFDLRPGRFVVLDDCNKFPVPYNKLSHEASFRFGVMACYQVVLMEEAEVRLYEAWESRD